MLPAVHFDDETFFQTDKIDDIPVDDVLSPKLVSREVTVTQNPPQLFFHIRLLLSQSLGQGLQGVFGRIHSAVPFCITRFSLQVKEVYTSR